MKSLQISAILCNQVISVIAQTEEPISYIFHPVGKM